MYGAGTSVSMTHASSGASSATVSTNTWRIGSNTCSPNTATTALTQAAFRRFLALTGHGTEDKQGDQGA